MARVGSGSGVTGQCIQLIFIGLDPSFHHGESRTLFPQTQNSATLIEMQSLPSRGIWCRSKGGIIPLNSLFSLITQNGSLRLSIYSDSEEGNAPPYIFLNIILAKCPHSVPFKAKGDRATSQILPVFWTASKCLGSKRHIFSGRKKVHAWQLLFLFQRIAWWNFTPSCRN